MKKLLFFILAFILFTNTAMAGGGEYIDAEVGLESLSISAQSFCLMDAKTNAVLHSKNEKVKLPMASTTKIMTALVAIENADLSKDVKITKESVGIEGSSIYLYEGEVLSLNDLVYALMLQSANDAAVAIALHVSGSVEKFAEKMNETARRLGMNDTQFKNPHGLHEDGHYSTAFDMSLLLSYAMQNEVFASITSTQNYKIPLIDGKNYRYITNHNKLLKTYSNCVGGKTGYTTSSGRCLVTAARKNNTLLVCTTLNAPDDWNDHRELFEYGFSAYESKTLCTRESIVYNINVVGGEKNEVVLTNLESVEISSSSDSPISMQIHSFPFLYAPVQGLDGDTAPAPLASAVYFQDGKEIARVMLYAKESIAYQKSESIWEKIKAFFGL